MTALFDTSPVEKERDALKEERTVLSARLFAMTSALGSLVDAIDGGKDPSKLLAKAKKVLGRE